MGEKSGEDEEQLGFPTNRRGQKEMGQNQEYDAHHESVKMSLLEQRVEIFGEEHLALDFSTEIVGDDPLVAQADALELKSPSCRQSSYDEEKKKRIHESDLEGGVAQPKR